MGEDDGEEPSMVLAHPLLPHPLELAVWNRDLARTVRRLRPELAPDHSGALPVPEWHQLPAAVLARLLFPHLCRGPFSPFHWHLLRQQDEAWGRALGARGRRLAVAAPRGHAKSTLASLVLPLLDLARGRQPYIVILSATVRQAAARVRNLRMELETNAALLSCGQSLKQRGRPWSARALRVSDALIEAYGALSEIRGLNHCGHRPSLIILDDTDATHRVRQPVHRTSLLAWFDEVVEPLGDRSTDILAVGTVLHPDSLLATLLRRPAWEGTLWKALVQPPQDHHLWSRWMTLLTAPDDPQAERAAEDFYREHRRAMLLGARALWPARDSVEDLHRFMALQGLGAFRKEKQNDPAPATAGPWSPARWRRFVLRQSTLFPLPDPPAEPPLDQPQAAWPALPPCWPLDQLALYGYLDPATGRPSRSGRLNDYAALITLARTPGPDPFYLVLEAWMAREPLERQVHQVVEAALRWGWHGFAFEANGFQSVLAPELTRALREAALPLGLSPLVPIPVTHSQAKDLRIERAGLLVQNGRLLFHAHLPAEFTQNASDYPQPGAHDDGLDALAAAIELARSRNPHQSQPSIRTIRRTDTRFP